MPRSTLSHTGFAGRLRYSAWAAARNRLGVLARGAAVAVLGFVLANCSLTMHLASFQPEDESTASTGRVSPLDPSLDEEDWRRAQAALSLAVDPQGGGQPVNWDNPATKRRGTFVAAGNMVLVESTICRPFTATIQQGAKEIRHSGQACRVGPGEWAMRDLATASIDKAPPKPELRQALPAKSRPMFEAREGTE